MRNRESNTAFIKNASFLTKDAGKYDRIDYIVAHEAVLRDEIDKITAEIEEEA